MPFGNRSFSQDDSFQIADIIPAVAQIIIARADTQTPVFVGSGVVAETNMSQWITNFHVVQAHAENPEEYEIWICITESEKKTPKCGMKASIERSNEVLDLALLKVEEVLDAETENWISFAEFDEKYGLSEQADQFDIDWEESTEVEIGEDIHILGYPLAGGSSITLTKGTVSGFETTEINGEEHILYIKTDTEISPGNSGGAAVNSNNEFVGMPTYVSSGEANIGYLISVQTLELFAAEEDEELTDHLTDLYGPYQCGENSRYYLNEGCVCDAYFEWANEEKDNFDCVPTKCDLNSHHQSNGACVCDDGYVWEDQNDTENLKCIEGETTSIFPDVPRSHKNFRAIEYLASPQVRNNAIFQVLNGYPDGTFKPRLPVNRAELLKIIIEAHDKYGKHVTFLNTAPYCFSDVPREEWFAQYVCYAKQQGWVNGYQDGSFKPAQTVSKAEAIKMMMEIFAFDIPEQANSIPFADVESGEWFAPYLEVAHENEILEETSGFYSPHQGMTRASVAESIYRILGIEFEEMSQEFERYHYPKHGFSLELPVTWAKVDGGSQLPLFAYPSIPADDRFPESVTVTKDRLETGITFSEYMETAKEQVADIVNEFKLIREEKEMIESGEGVRLEYSAKNPLGIDVQVIAYAFLNNDSEVYILSYGASAQSIDKLREIFIRSGESFRFE